MYRVSREMSFCYGHRLLNYDGKCRHLHGHNGRLVVTLEAPGLDPRGMLVDFGDIKRTLQRWVDETLDHNLLLAEGDPIIPALQAQGERFMTMSFNPTAENIARLIFEKGREFGLPIVEVKLWETDNCHASYSS